MNCPKCGSSMIAGPRGGMAQNYYCSNREDCRAGFNVVMWRGETVSIEYLGEIEDVLIDMYARPR